MIEERIKLHCPCGKNLFHLYEDGTNKCVFYEIKGGQWHLKEMKKHRFKCEECK